jgi:hypothetical protein
MVMSFGLPVPWAFKILPAAMLQEERRRVRQQPDSRARLTFHHNLSLSFHLSNLILSPRQIIISFMLNLNGE